jgi:diguanylate cyclase (GGDEF)-like protein/PAS domain S-box-containing protein
MFQPLFRHIPTISLTTLGGAVSLMISVAVIFGWIVREPRLVSILTSPPMVLSTALCFALIAIAIIFNNLPTALRTPLHAAISATVMTIAVLNLAEYLFNLNPGTDLPGLHRWLQNENPYPGRMSPITAMAFMMCSVVLALMHHVRRLWSGLVVQVLTLAVGVIGMTEIAGRILRLDFLYQDSWFRHTGFLDYASFIISAMLLWLCWRQSGWYRARTLIKSDSERIALTGALVLGIALSVSGLSVFSVMSVQIENAIGEGLMLTLKSRVNIFTTNIDLRTDRARLVATRPTLIAYLRQLNSRPDDAATLKRLHGAAQSFLAFDFDGITLYSQDDNDLISVGKFAQRPELSVKLPMPYPAYLIWSEGFKLTTKMPMQHDGQTVGFVTIEQSLQSLTEAMSTAPELGKTGETAVCDLQEDRFFCFPQRLLPRVFNIPYSPTLPMSRAFDRKASIVKSRDYRAKNVIAAHGPIGGTGLGMVVKMDASEFYAPLLDQLQAILVLLMLMILGGAVLLRFQIKPLTKRIINSEERLKLALDASKLALWDWNLVNGQIYLSEQWRTILGGNTEPTLTTLPQLQQLVHPDDIPPLQNHLRETLKGNIQQYNFEHRVRTLSGEWKWIRSSGQVVERDRSGRALRLTGTNTDINMRKQAELQLTHQATHDQMTGLPNRELFYDRLMQAMTRSQRNKSLMAVLYLDIDKFKGINDSLGHAMGDALLKGFSRRLESCVRAIDTVARLGGDEFSVILGELSTRDDGLRIADKIVVTMRPEFELEYRTITTTTSVGIAFYDGAAGVNSDALIKKADEALYEAKGAGRNNYQVAD